MNEKLNLKFNSVRQSKRKSQNYSFEYDGRESIKNLSFKNIPINNIIIDS